MPSPLTDQAILGEIGRRLAEYRLSANLTQAQLATRAGVSKRTLERAEAGDSIQLLTLIRLLRELDLLAAIEQWLAPPKPSPLAQLAEQKLAERKGGYQTGRKKRVRKQKNSNSKQNWEWGQDA